MALATRTVLGEDVIEERRPSKAGSSLTSIPGDGKQVNTMLQALLPMPILDGLSLEPGRIAVHANSLTNERASLYNRVLMKVPTMKGEMKRGFSGHAARVLEMVHSKVGTLEQWGMKRTLKHMVVRHGAGLYVPAAQSLQDRPLDNRDTMVSMFIKVEKNYLPGEKLKTPRAIQYRGPRFNLMLAKFLLPYEEKFYSEFSKPNSTRLHTSKGLTPDARANLISALWDRHPRPLALNLDASRFDAHVTKELLQQEAAFYKRAHKNNRLLEFLLKAQRCNRGQGRWGSKYRVEGCRMSGDVNTALGNTLIQLVVLSFLFRDVHVDILVEGDDAVVFGDVDALRRAYASLDQRAGDIGFTLSSSIARCKEEVDYCSSKIIEVEHGKWRSVRNWPKPFFTDCYTAKPVFGEKARLEKARTMAVGYDTMYHGLPVFGAWGSYLLSHAKPGKLDPAYDAYFFSRAATAAANWHVDYKSSGLLKSVEPTSLSRASFYVATGISPSEQLLWESRLKQQLGPWPANLTGDELSFLEGLAARLQPRT